LLVSFKDGGVGVGIGALVNERLSDVCNEVKQNMTTSRFEPLVMVNDVRLPVIT
jgi:hypothetical protein